MSIYKQDSSGNKKKIAGYLVQRWNDMIFLTSHSYSGDGLTEYYDIDPSASAYLAGLTDFTRFQLYIGTPNTGENVYIRFAGKQLKVQTNTGDDPKPGEMTQVVDMYTMIATATGLIIMNSIGSYPQLDGLPEINGITLLGQQRGRDYQLADMLPTGATVGMILNPAWVDDGSQTDPDIAGEAMMIPDPTGKIDFATATREQLLGNLGQYVEINTSKTFVDDKDNDYINEGTVEIGQTTKIGIIRSKDVPLWDNGTTKSLLATEQYVDERAAADRYMGMIDYAISTWSNIDEATIGQTAVALDTKEQYVCITSYVPESPNPAWVDDGNESDPDGFGEPRYLPAVPAVWELVEDTETPPNPILLEPNSGDYWVINFFPEHRMNPGKIIWNGITTPAQWDLAVSNALNPDEVTIVTDESTRRFSIAKLPYTLTLGYKNMPTDPAMVPTTQEVFDSTENIEFAITPSTDAGNQMTIGTDGRLYVKPSEDFDDGTVADPFDWGADFDFDDGNVI